MGLFSRKKDDVVVEIEDTEPDVPIIGPWDEADHPEREDRIDAGVLWLPQVEGAQIQFSIDKNRTVVLGMVYLKDRTAIQLQVFAAPKSGGLWEDIRADLISSVASQGGKFSEADGEFGHEVHAKMPVPGGQQVAPVRYIGIDGPRWLLRVTVSGKAANDETLSNQYLHEILDDLVVVRGQEPHPPRELLPLSLPKVKAETPSRPTLELPRRGPEISEVR